jgi:hypothetical protein
MVTLFENLPSSEAHPAHYRSKANHHWIVRQIAVVILLASCSAVANAQLLDYGTFSGYGLKKGILGNDYNNPLAACVTGTESTLPASHAAVRASITYSEDEYKRAFHIDQQAQATILGIGGGGDELHFGQENAGSSYAFNIIIEAYGEHPSNTIDHVTLDPKYEAMLNSGDAAKIQQVRATCGDRYIQTVFNETRLFAVLHVSKQLQSSLTTFAGKANGSVNIDVVSASASLGGDANISSAHKVGAVNIDIYSEGLGGVVPTASAIGIVSDDALQAVAAKLAAYLATLHDTGQPVKYRLTNLPGLPVGSLSDSRIFDYLNDLKTNYSVIVSRLGNVRSLLTPFDPRRSILKQPQADVALKTLQNSVTTYLDSVAKAHDACRKALTLDECATIVSRIETAPSALSVELPPAVPSTVGEYIFAINGAPVPPGQTALLIPSSGTLLNAARTLQPNATNVDVLAYVYSTSYLSYIDARVLLPQPAFWVQQPPPQLIVVGDRKFLAQELSFPPYWEGPTDANILAFHVLHADSQHPCNVSTSDGVVVTDESCLTPNGRALRDVTLAYAAEQAIARPLPVPSFAVWLSAISSSCFQQNSPAFGYSLGFLSFTPSFQPNVNQVSVQTYFSLPMITSSPSVWDSLPLPLAIFVSKESHDPQTWNQIAQTRLAALNTAPHNPMGTNPCSPHIP